MLKKLLPSRDALNARLRYDPEAGKLFWRARSADDFTTSDPRGARWVAAQCNAQYAGKEAFTATDTDGYHNGKIDGVKYQAHRVIWKLLTGDDPDQIDHRNGIKGDNRFENLRDCSNEQNCRNYEKPRGSSKYRGVCWVKRDQKWAASISAGSAGKKSLGHYGDERTAALAYDDAARKFHGEFATLNFPEERADDSQH